MTINGQRIMVEGKALRIASFEQEWYEDIEDPKTLINELSKSRSEAGYSDLLATFTGYATEILLQQEMEPIAALPIKSYSYWWDKQIDCKTRNMVRKSQKKGVTVRMVSFDDELFGG